LPSIDLPFAVDSNMVFASVEGRLALVRIVGDDVIASHGIMVDDFATSRPLRAREVADRFVQKESHHLDPYVVWWGGIGEMDERGIALTLVPSRDAGERRGVQGQGCRGNEAAPGVGRPLPPVRPDRRTSTAFSVVRACSAPEGAARPKRRASARALPSKVRHPPTARRPSAHVRAR